MSNFVDIPVLVCRLHGLIPLARCWVFSKFLCFFKDHSECILDTDILHMTNTFHCEATTYFVN